MGYTSDNFDVADLRSPQTCIPRYLYTLNW